jgi:DNA polymerase-3 subunit beta
MKLTILQEKLKKGLSVVERVSSKSLSLPVLNNILISADKNMINLVATDLEIGINWWDLSKTESEGKITIPAHLFSGFVGMLPNEKIEIEEEKDGLLIKCKKNKTQIKGISAEEFPIIPRVNEGENISVNSSVFCQNLAQVADIASPSNTRPEISGVYLVFQKNQITMVSTDSFRLAEKKIFLKQTAALNKDYNLIIPQRAVKEIINIFGEYNKDLKIYFSSNQIMFEVLMEETNHPHIQLVSRLIEGEYPNYKEIIPTKHSTQITLERNEFINQVKTASFFAGKVNEIKIKANEKEIEISSQSSDVGNHLSAMSAKITGEETEVAFNHKFLLDGLVNIKSSEVVLELNGDAGAAVLRPVGDDTYLYVVMPIKAQ